MKREGKHEVLGTTLKQRRLSDTHSKVMNCRRSSEKDQL